MFLRAVPRRAVHVARITKALPGVTVLWCKQDPNRAPWLRATDNFLRALELSGDGPSIHLEDDIILCPDFEAKLAAEIAARPDRVINGFSRRKEDLTIGSRWDGRYGGALCTYLPPGYPQQIIDYVPTYLEQKGQEPDGMVELDDLVDYWLKSRKEKHWIVVPNLVDHVVGPSSVQKIRNHGRISKTFHRHFEDH
jgi:hypothetical protein